MKKNVNLLRGSLEILKKMGTQIRLARLRREIGVDLVSKRSGLSRTTIWNIENGNPSVSIGAYAAVLHAIGGMDKELEAVCRDDPLGRTLQDLNLKTRQRAPKRGSEDGRI